MFSSLLIANRGEIACRVIATARRLGLRTIAVYSDADKAAPHVAAADKAIHIGAPAPRDSYLRGERIVEAALEAGADAIHPGYGFLSESPVFAKAVERAGLIFVGPPASAIRAMGLKDEAKSLMARAGVPMLPGYHDADQDIEKLAARANDIGYPLLIKARAGGGGRGMRLVDDPSALGSALASAQREAEAAFGDTAVLLEAFIPTARHIEIQVLSDAHGNALHLFERDCSLQRRHQKVVEEAPAPAMPADLRGAMGATAVAAAKAIGYQGAGTVEFIVDSSRELSPDRFWFMEMNTRLQVEHPVTEAITGLDLVELQLRVAAGEPIPFSQEEVSLKGHAFEARIYAEDPAAGFLPATGRLDHLSFPDAGQFTRAPLRIDTGLRAGDTIDPWYDPLIAKVVVHSQTRKEALRQLTTALRECRVAGPANNIDFLTALTEHEAVRQGDLDTGLIARDVGALTAKPAAHEHIVSLAAVAAGGLLAERDAADPWDWLAGWRHWPVVVERVLLDYGEARLERGVIALGDCHFRVEHDDGGVEMTVRSLSGVGFAIEIGAVLSRVDVVLHGARITIFADGRSYAFVSPRSPRQGRSTEDRTDTIAAPMPGVLRAVTAIQGRPVTAGETLAVLEAMKMEHVLKATRDGIVSEVLATEGDQVAEGTVLVRLEPDDGGTMLQKSE